MSYLDDVEQRLREMLGPDEAEDKDVKDHLESVITYVNKRIIESYRNGIQAAKLVKDYRRSQNQNKKREASK